MIQKGISAVLPFDYLALYNSRQFERIILGIELIDIEKLKSFFAFETTPDIIKNLFIDSLSELNYD